MPRNGAGIFSLDARYLVSEGDTILPSQHNPVLEDIQTDANTPRPIVAGGTGASTATTARTNLSVYSIADVDDGFTPKVATRTALKALDTATTKAVVLTEASRQKLFMWMTGDFTDSVAGDTSELAYIPADGIDPALGCWVAVTGAGATIVPVIQGGTGANDAATALDNLGGMASTTYDPNAVSGDVFDMANMVEATDAKIMTAAERTKLTGIEAGADVTDAANVDAAGATMNTDTDVSGNSWVNSAGPLADSAATVPAENVVKAYVDGLAVKAFDIVSDAEAATIAAGIDALIVAGRNYVRVTEDYELLGPELAENGGFDTDTDWGKGTGWTISGGVATHSGATPANLNQDDIDVAGAYLCSFDLTSITQGAVRSYLLIGVTQVLGVTRAIAGRYSDVLVASGDAASVGLAVGLNPFAGSVDNFSVRALPADAFQSSDGAWWGPIVPSNVVLPVADRTALKAVDTAKHSAAYLLESGREGQFVWNSSDLSTFVTADTAEGVYVAPTSDATGASGAWVRMHNGELRPEFFGAAGDGTTNDTTAFTGMAAVCDLGGFSVRLAAKDYLIRDQIAFNGSLSLFGAGRGETSLIWDASATAEGVKVVFTDATHRVNVRDLDFLRDGATTGTALHIDGTATVNAAATPTIQPRNGNRGLIENVGFKGATEVTDDQYPDCWAIGCHAESVVGLLIDGYEARGAYLTANTRSGTAFKIDGAGLPVSTHINNGSIYHADLCVDILHCEGIYIKDFEWVAVGKGVKWRTTGGVSKPHLIVGDGHINGFDGGLDLNNINQAMIHDILFYRMTQATADPYIHILIDAASGDDCLLNSIHDCTFSGKEIGIGNDIELRTCKNTSIGQNIHQVGHTMIGIDTGCSDTTIADQPGGVGSTGISNYDNTIINSGIQTKMPGFITKVYASGATSISNNTLTTIEFNTVLSNSAASGEVYKTANPSRLYAHRTGLYRAEFGMSFAGNVTGYRRADIIKNGAGFTGGVSDIRGAVPVASVATAISGSGSFRLDIGDYIELRVQQNSGGNLDVSTGAWLSLTWLGD